MSKQIHFAGVSRVKGVLTFRTAGSPARAQQLAKLGDTDINMIMLRGEVLTKSQAAKQLLAREFSDNAEILALLTSVATDDNPFAKPKAVKKVKTVVAKDVKVKRQTALDKVFPEIKMTPSEAARQRRYWMNNVLRPVAQKMSVGE